MKTIYKVIKTDGTRGGSGLFNREWFCTTKELAEAFKAAKEKSEPHSTGYQVVAVPLMVCEDDFYKKELR